MTTDRSQGERLPAGFTATVANIGIKDSTDDIVVIAAEGGCASAGVFTRNRFAGPSVTVSRENLRGGRSDAHGGHLQERQLSLIHISEPTRPY